MESINCTNCGSTEVYFNSLEGLYVCKNCDSKFSNANLEEEHNVDCLISTLKELVKVAKEIGTISKEYNEVTKYKSAEEYAQFKVNDLKKPIKPEPVLESSFGKASTPLWISFFISLCIFPLGEALMDNPDFTLLGDIICGSPIILFILAIIATCKRKNYDCYIGKSNQYQIDLINYENERDSIYQSSIDYYNSTIEAMGSEALTKKINWLKENKDILPEMYYNRIQTIIKILESRRADSIKEAINVMIQDDRVDALFESKGIYRY